MKRILIGLAAWTQMAAAARAASPYPAWGKEFARMAKDAGMERIAVLPFEATDGKDSREGVQISEELVTQIVRAGKVQAVERSLIQRLMDEHRLARSGALEASSLRKLGKILTVQGLVTGSYDQDGSKIHVHARLIDVETGLIIAAERSTTSGRRPAAPAAVEIASSETNPVCRGAARRVDTLELTILDLKARYWANEIAVEGNGALAGTAAATITDPAMRQQFLAMVRAWENKEVPPLTREESRLFVQTDQKAFALHRTCGL